MKLHHLMLSAAIVAVFGVASLPANAETKHSSKTSEVIADQKPVSTVDFVKKASMGDMYEIKASQLVLDTEGTSDPAREFAQQTIKAHTDISANLKTALGESKEKVAPATALDSMQTAELNKMKAIDDPAMLSSEYLKAMSMFHDKAVMLYENYSVNGSDARLKEFAMTQLPIVKSHNDHLKGLEISK